MLKLKWCNQAQHNKVKESKHSSSNDDKVINIISPKQLQLNEAIIYKTEWTLWSLKTKLDS